MFCFAEFVKFKSSAQLNWIAIVLLGAIIGLLPMIVYVRLVAFDGIAAKIYGPSVQGNLHSYYKAVWLNILANTELLWLWRLFSGVCLAWASPLTASM